MAGRRAAQGCNRAKLSSRTCKRETAGRKPKAALWGSVLVDLPTSNRTSRQPCRAPSCGLLRGPGRGEAHQVPWQHSLFPGCRPATSTLVSTPSGAGSILLDRFRQAKAYNQASLRRLAWAFAGSRSPAVLRRQAITSGVCGRLASLPSSTRSLGGRPRPLSARNGRARPLFTSTWGAHAARAGGVYRPKPGAADRSLGNSVGAIGSVARGPAGAAGLVACGWGTLRRSSAILVA